MGAKLYKENNDNIKKMRDLEYGETAVVISTGKIIAPFRDAHWGKRFMVIGECDGYTNPWYCGTCDYPVRVLQRGELIEIT